MGSLCKLRTCLFNLRKFSTRNKRNINTVGCNIESTEVKAEAQKQPKRSLLDGPNLRDFFTKENLQLREDDVEIPNVPYISNLQLLGSRRKVHFEVYGCQMNVNDTEVIWSILKGSGFVKTDHIEEADIILIMTCAIREGAEDKIWHRLKEIKAMKRKRFKDQPQLKVGLLGCMAERLKTQALEKEQLIDVIAGPDSYRDLPRLLALTNNNQKAVNVLLSLDETYADITPVRLNENAVTAFVSIMRGCDNMCTYCIVPFTRGRERSRPISSILDEVRQLSEQGVKEITLLGQNVNSYRDLRYEEEMYDMNAPTKLAKGFKTVYKTKVGGLRFADLLEKVADINPEIRIRFTSPHPKDFPDEVLQVIQSKANICRSFHLPAQSGNSDVLERMRRGYTREAYLELVEHVRNILPNITLSSDFICGFCGETEAEFEDTLSLMEEVRYNVAYLFAYSMREKTTAHRRFKDDVPKRVKQNRLERMVKVFRAHANVLNQAQIGKQQLILIEGHSKRSNLQLAGRNDGNIKVIIPNYEVPNFSDGKLEQVKPGDYVLVQINAANSQVLKGIPLYKTSLREYSNS